ncbi:MAG: Stk1 family PASTA domain-containing Ser/Thr kinase [Roseburia sp.]|nr:Stk1 family PASTA domain-containing Ser/Thr kinase [Roseburia sp.]
MITQGMYIADRYEIIGKVGAGGMSDVYKAMDHTLGRHVAIKVLKSEFSEDVNFVTKFRTEAQSAAGLEHPNIVNIYDVGSESEFHYIVMELIEGITLKTYIEKKGQLSFKEAASIAIQVGRGIEAAHNKGIIHRDIKPQNIIISTEGKVKVTDFGIAKAATSNTISSDVMGSVHYSSPEQARNGFVDGKSDIYSLGIVMYEMITGRVPFDGDTTVAVAIQHLQEEMESPKTYAPELPISMEKIILKCTQKNPDRRYESITALLSDLRKSLISPDEDFVVIAPVSQDKTRIIGADEVDKIKQKTGNIHVDEATLVENVSSEEEYEEVEEYDEEDDIDPRMDKAITIAGIAAGVIIVILIIVILMNFLGGFGADKDPVDTQQQTTTTETQVDTEADTEATIELIDLTGLTIADARELLLSDGLGIKKAGTVASDEFEEGEIISQIPEAGEMVSPNTTIEVIVSSGAARIEVPSVKGLSEKKAKDKLEDTGFEVDVEYDYSDTVEEGYVISQTPGATSLANEGDTITITVSEGPDTKMVTVPGVFNTKKANAIKRLEEAGFVVEVIEMYSNDIEKGYVVSQSVPGNTQAEAGTVIKLYVSIGKSAIVPKVVGLSESAARTALTNAGLKVGTVTTESKYSDVPAGQVVKQDVAANTEVAEGSVVNLVISKGPEPETEKPDTETPGTENTGGEGDEGNSSQTPSTDTPSTDTPSSETPSTDTPSSETPSTDTPSSETPSSETPGNETTGSEVTN